MEIKTKFNIGDMIFYIEDNQIERQKVSGIFYQNYYDNYHPENRTEYITYETELNSGKMWADQRYRVDARIGEDRCFSSKQDLINSL